jgi:hypothetical protein
MPVNSIEELAKRIDYDFPTKEEKTRALYTWIAYNITYYEPPIDNFIKVPEIYVVTDQEDLNRRILKENEEIIASTFINRQAVCKGFALLFNKACTLLKIQNELVKGYVKVDAVMIGKIPKNKNHVWNAVKLADKWIFIDVTWGSEHRNSKNFKKRLNTYFNIKKEDLRLTHYPSNTFWSEYINHKSLTDFCDQPVFNEGMISSEIEIIEPKVGEIIVDKNKKINLKFKGLNFTTKIYYSYNNDFYIKEVNHHSKNSVSQISIDVPENDANLNIFFNLKLALQYKVVIK